MGHRKVGHNWTTYGICVIICGLMKSERISPEHEVTGSNPVGRTRE